MKITRLTLAMVLLTGLLETTWAANTYYVTTNGPGGIATDWATAKSNIQDAINLTLDGDLVLVSNGVYDVSGTAIAGTITNRVVITKAITVRSLNGPIVTIIKGARNASTTNGVAAVRCVYMTNNATLSGFTITNGATGTNSTEGQSGGGIMCEGTNAVITNCIISGNAAYVAGGGVYSGVVYNCILNGNSTPGIGGGIVESTCYNCTIVNNSAGELGGGGAYNANLINCIVYYNSATAGEANYAGTCAFANSCTTPDPGSGSENITSDPSFLNAGAGNYRLAAGSPCINAGTNQDWMTNSVDLDGLARIVQGRVDMGAYESEYFFSLGPTAFDKTVMQGSATNFSVFLTNSSDTQIIYWQAVKTNDWVTLSPSSGTIATNSSYNATTNFTIANSSLGLNPTSYYSRLTVTPTNIPFYPQTGTVDMTMHVAAFGRSPTQMTATVKQHGTTNATVSIWNTGGGSLPYTVNTNFSWLNVSPASGTLTGQTDTLTVVFTNTPLQVGTYYGALTLVSGIDGSTLDIEADLTVTTGPQMSVSPLILTGSVMMGQNLTNQYLNVSNNIAETIDYRAEKNISWLTVSPTNWQLDPGASTNLTVSYQTVGLATNSSAGPSNYNAVISITASNADVLGSPANVAVTVTVNPKARLDKNTVLITNIVKEGYDAPDSNFEVWNGNGYYTLNFTVSDDADWFVLTPSSGTSTGAHVKITASYSTAGLTVGGHSAQITVVGRSYTGTNWGSAVDATQIVDVWLLVTPTAALATDALTTYEFSTHFGHPVDSKSFQLWNAVGGGSVLQYTIAKNMSWLSASPTTGTSADENDKHPITFTCNTANMRPGRYTGTLTASGIDRATGIEARNSPASINVALTIIRNKGFDFSGNGGGASDLVVYKESSGLWNITNLISHYTTNVMFGGKGYVPVPGDFDGDMISDLGIYRYSSGYWYVRNISDQHLGEAGGSYWAWPNIVASMGGYVSAAGDYDGDGLTDPTMYREISGLWSVLLSDSNYARFDFNFGGSGYVSIPADYDGDGLTDPAVYNETTGQWCLTYSSVGYLAISGLFGAPGWTAIPADYDGDGLADAAVYQEATGLWYILPTDPLRHGVPIIGPFGGPGYVPVPADYDGDGSADACVYDEATGNWYIISVTKGTKIAWPIYFGGYGFSPVRPW